MNRLSDIVAQRLRDKGTMTYDHIMMSEVAQLTNDEIVEIGILGMTKDNLVNILNYMLDKVDNIDSLARLDENTSIRNDVSAIYDIVNDIIKILYQKTE